VCPVWRFRAPDGLPGHLIAFGNFVTNQRIEIMNTTRQPRFFAQAGAFALAFAIVLNSSTSSAASKDRSKPTTPGNFRVTAKTAYTVTVAWSPSSDNSGDFSYQLSGAYHVTPAVLPKTATNHTFTALHPGNEYWFFIYAKDAAGNYSGQASVTTRTLLDTTPPSTAPVITVNEVGSTYAKISWTRAEDDGPYQFYEVWIDGIQSFNTGTNISSSTLRSLQPDTAYTIQVRAYDYGQNRSPFSEPVTVTTLPPNPNDTTPPTTPANLSAETFGDGSTETHLRWTQSTDDFDAQSNIRYDVYVNGVLQDILFGSGGPSLVYADRGESLIEVIATDTAGNASAPATITVIF
jgi:chitodextrinase